MYGPSFPSFQEAIEEQLTSRRALLQGCGGLLEAVGGAQRAAERARERAAVAASTRQVAAELERRVEHTAWSCRRLVEMAWLAESREGEGLVVQQDELFESLLSEAKPPKAAELAQ